MLKTGLDVVGVGGNESCCEDASVGSPSSVFGNDGAARAPEGAISLKGGRVGAASEEREKNE